MTRAPEVRVFETSAELFEAARAAFVALARDSIADRGRFRVSLAGGKTPERLYRLLSAADVAWSRVQLLFGDERCVPPHHADSNYRMACEALLERVGVPESNVHRMRGEVDPADAAAEYGHVLRTVFGSGAQPFPRFDLCLLGLGADGHTASLFPGTTALTERERACVATWVEKLGAWRLTLTFPVFEAARNVWFLALGADKAEQLARATSPVVNTASPPAARARPQEGSLIWFVDRLAAERLA